MRTLYHVFSGMYTFFSNLLLTVYTQMLTS